MTYHIDLYHVSNTANIGDHSCPPHLHMPLGIQVNVHDIRDPDVNGSTLAIIGGGGLFEARDLQKRVSDVLKRHSHVVCWGAGLNNKPESGIDRYPDWMDRFALCGVRDWAKDVPYRWVPCPSCMHPVFNENIKPDHPVVVYNHKDHPFVVNPVIPKDIPRMNNCEFGKTPEDAIRFIASGATVLTTSYHGAYWGVLLGRRVVVQGKHSDRFNRFRYPIANIGKGHSWARESVIADSKPLKGSSPLIECRQANLAFRDEVRSLIRSL